MIHTNRTRTETCQLARLCTDVHTGSKNGCQRQVGIFVSASEQPFFCVNETQQLNKTRKCDLSEVMQFKFIFALNVALENFLVK